MPSSASKDAPDFDQVVQEEIKGLEELIPQPADDEESDGPPGFADSPEDERPKPPPKPEATLKRRRKDRSRP